MIVAHDLDETQQILLDQISDAIAILDARQPSLPPLAINRACRNILPDQATLLDAAAWADLFPPTAAHDIPAELRAVVASGEAREVRGVALTRGADASRRPSTTYWDWKGQPVRDAAGRVARVIVTMTDVTPQRRGARAQQLNADLTEQVPLGIAITDGPEHVVTLANGRLAKILGCDREGLIDRPFFVGCPELAPSRLAALMTETYLSGMPLAIEELPIARGPSEAAWWNVRLLAVPDLAGQIGGLMLMIADVTAQVRDRREMVALAEAARSRAGELEAVIGALVDGLFILNKHGDVVEANPAGLRLLNLPPDFRGRRLHEFLQPPAVRRDDGQTFDPLDNFLGPVLAGQVRADEQLLIDAESTDQPERYISLTGTPIRSAPGAVSGAVILVRDISAHKRADQEKDAFLSLISHEIKSPLTSIKGFSQLAVRAIESDAAPLQRTRKHLRVIEQQTDRIGRLISDLSDVSRLQRGRLQLDPTVFDLVPAVRATVEQQQSALGEYRVTVALPDGPLIVRADPQRIQQILAILLDNAAKYSPQVDHIAVTLDRHGERAQLAVRDRGIGIPSEDQPRIFDRFYRAPGGGGSGLGLGLFIARQIAARSDGALTVESEQGAGSTFRLDLPLARPDSATDD